MALYLLNHSPRSLDEFKCVLGDSRQAVLSTYTNDTLIEESGEESNYTAHLSLIVQALGIKVLYEEVPTLLSWKSGQHLEFKEWDMEVLSTYCQPLILTCDRSLLRQADVEMVGDAIRPKGYKDLIGPGQYASTGSGAIMVCASALRKAEEELKQSSEIEGWLTLIGISLSMLGLALTFLVYSSFPSLRNIPGLGIMNLCLALFVAQLLFELSALVSASGCEWLCMVAGAVQHYSWLVAFLWMNVLAYDVTRTFTTMTTKDAGSRTANYRIYLLYSWGFPALAVGVCMTLKYGPEASFDYIDLDTCWLEAGRVLLLAFGIPLALVVAINIVLFIRTAVALRDAMKIASRATCGKTREAKTRYGIYIKLALLMGFTWILGFLAALLQADVTTYLFIMANSLQGLFISLSFVCTRQVGKLIGKKISGWQATFSDSFPDQRKPTDSQWRWLRVRSFSDGTAARSDCLSGGNRDPYQGYLKGKPPCSYQ